ncbi:MAG TPA: hypothetical protein VFT95_03955 [Micromonosporaceae bacterium]|nr:hypothetical protein [Micromonosporaceae bacterium]
MRTVIPPQFSGEDLQRLLTLALSAPAGDDPVPATAPATAPATMEAAAPASVQALAPVDLPPADVADGDGWDEPW